MFSFDFFLRIELLSLVILPIVTIVKCLPSGLQNIYLRLSVFSQVFLAVIASAMAAPQIVPYQHVEIPAEPYIHQEIPAEPYVHQEPALTPEALGQVAYNAPAVPTGYAAAPVIAGAWAGNCINNLGQGVPCRQ